LDTGNNIYLLVKAAIIVHVNLLAGVFRSCFLIQIYGADGSFKCMELLELFMKGRHFIYKWISQSTIPWKLLWYKQDN
jgi:hypothetical protein